MVRRFLRASLLLLPFAPLLLLVPLAAAGPSFWTVATTADFLQGTSDGVYVSLSGQLTPGPALTSRLSTTPAQVWTVARGDDGTLWAGTGGDGRVIRLAPDDAAETTVFDADEANIFAVAVDGDRVFAASSPEGRVYVIEGDEPARVFFDPAENYIWALAVDDEGRLWVGTGTPATIYRVEADGTSAVVHRPPATHVVQLRSDGQGRMLAGTESPGRLYRYDSEDRPFALLDTDLAELSAVAVTDDNVVWAAAVARGDASGAGGETTSVAITMAATATSGSSAAANGSTSGGSTTSSTATPARRSAIFRIDPSGVWEEVWTTADVVYDLAAGDEGLLVATGPAGRMYRITPELDVALHTGIDTRQITRFAAGPDGVAAFATANPGRLLTLGTGRQAPASYTSAVHDTGSVATWGLIRWDGTEGVELFTRSGNTARPDDSWSAWSSPYVEAAGETIVSPTARFIQWRAELASASAGPGPSLRSVTVAYLLRNSRPVVGSLTLHPPGVVFKRPFVNDESAIAGMDEATIETRRPPGEDAPSTPALTERMFQRGLQTIVWRAEDDDEDLLTYSVHYRSVEDETWRMLKTDLIGQIYVWDTTTVPDGRYVIRVAASDRLSNPGDRALTGSRDSDVLVVDNTPPVIDVTTEADRLIVTVRDAGSAIAQLEYAVAGGAWQTVYPEDGLADSAEERFVIPLPEGVDRADVMLRAGDRLHNTVSRPGAP